MEHELLHRVLFLQLQSGREVDISVVGVSMEPSLSAGDVITVRRENDYAAGDVLVFLYKNGELLTHRLLFERDGRYFCKGDNALRLEDVTQEQIAGRVIKKNGGEVPSLTPVQLTLSYLVSRCFRQCGYDADQAKKSGIYRFYKHILHNTEDKTLTYQKNLEMDYIAADASSLAVFDAESGDTHFFDETGVDILNCLEEPTTLEALLDKLCEIYEATPDDIRADVEEFLADCVAKKVVIVA